MPPGLNSGNLNSGGHRHGGNLIEEARKLKINVKSILDASASLIPFSPPQELIHVLEAGIRGESLRIYPDRTYYSLRKAISSWHKLEPNMILPGNGAAELFTWAAKDSSSKGVSGLPAPCFTDYERALRCWNASYKHIPLPLTWSSQYPQAFPIKPDSNVLWITNPHNPTGQLWSKKSLQPLLNQYELIICDEAFLPLVPNGENESLVPLVGQHKNLIIIRSLTKLFSIAGLRLGYAISSPERLKTWQEWRDPWPVNGLAVEAGKVLLNNHSDLKYWMEKIQSWIKKEGPWFEKRINSLSNIRAHASAANFHLIQSNNSLLELQSNLLKRKILVRDCRSFMGLGDNWIRISLQDHNNNKLIFETIKDLQS